MIILPDSPSPAAASPIYIDFGGIQGVSVEQRVNRLGNRFGISVTMPPMRREKNGRIWESRLVQAQTEGARMEWPLMGFDAGVPGTVVVDGAGQAGTTLNVRGATPNYAFREGQYFSIETGGVHHMHQVAAETLADASGEAALPLTAMIRQQHADGDACHIARPMIEGFLRGDRRQWEYALGNFVGMSFEIHERK